MLQMFCRICVRTTNEANVTKLSRQVLLEIQLISGVMLEATADLPQFICYACQKDLHSAIEFRTRCLRNYKRWPPQSITLKTDTELMASLLTKRDNKDTMDWILPKPVVELKLVEKDAYGDDDVDHLIEFDSVENNAYGDDDVDHLIEFDSVENNAYGDDDVDPLIEFDSVENNAYGDDDDDPLIEFDSVENNAYGDDDDDPLIEFDSMESNADGDDVDHFIEFESIMDIKTNVHHLNKESDDENTDIIMSKKKTYKPLKKKNAEQPCKEFICEQCGKKLKHKVSLNRHILQHNGDRAFKCQKCPARFFSVNEVNMHQVMHTGARKYACRYCDRDYVSYSGRQRHERGHTNDRPFVCTQCGMTFTRNYVLKIHMLSHTGERKFRCESCDRSFLHLTSFKLHCRTKVHKKNIGNTVPPDLQLTQKEEVVCATSEIVWIKSLTEEELDDESEIPHSDVDSY